MAMSDQDVPVGKHGVVRIPVVHPWALEPYVAIGQAPPAAHETPWQVLCAHGLSCKLTRGSSGARSFFLPCGYRAPPLHADHGFRGAAPAVAALQVPSAEPHYAHRQAISLHELRARMADAITDWLGGRALHMHFGAIFFSVARLRAFLGAVKGTFRL